MHVKGQSVRTKPLSLGRARLALILAVAASAIALVAPGSASAACPGGASPYATAVTANASLLGYWRLDEAAGATTACATKGPAGAYNGGVTFGITPSATSAADTDTAVQLDGTSGFVSVADDGTLNPSPFTVEAWVKPTIITGSQAVVRKDGQFYLKVYEGKLQGWLWTSATTKVTVTSTAAVMVANQWQQVALTYTGSTATLYRNGASVGSASIAATIAATPNPLHWGDALTGGIDQNFLGGGIDEPAIYGTALSATEINNHYKAATTTPPTPPAAPQGLGATGGQGQVALSWTGSAGATSYNVYRGTTAGAEAATPVKTGVTGTSTTDTGLANSTQYFYIVKAVGSGGESGPSNEANATTNAAPACSPNTSAYSTAIKGTAGLTGYWRLGDASGSTTACASQGVNGSYASGASPGAAGSIANDPDTAASLNGTSGFISVPSAGAVASGPLTIEAWVKPTSVTGSYAIARKEGSYYLKIYNGALQGWIWTGATTKVTVTSNANVVSTGSWQHVAMVYNGSTVTFYVNGAAVGSGSASGTMPATGNDLHWGDVSSGGTESTWFSGTMDEVAIYGQALSASTVLSHYQTGSGSGGGGTKPAAPTGLVATGSVGQIALKWTGSAGATSYNIYRSAANGTTVNPTPYKTNVTSTSYTDTGLAANTTYVYTVAAVNAAGASAQSTGTEATTSPGTSGLVSLWHMEETSGTKMADSVGTNHGVIKSGVNKGQPGFSQFGFGFTGNASTSYVEVPDSSTLNPGSSNVAIVLHMKTSQTPPTSVEDWDMMRKGLYTDGAEFKIEYYPPGSMGSTGAQAGCSFLGTAAYTGEHPAGPALNDNKWHTIECLKTSTGYKEIVDGVTVRSTAILIGSITVAQPVEIGARPQSEAYVGSLDEISITKF